jgi:hypothetical protein
MARLKTDGQVNVEADAKFWMDLAPEEGERLDVNSSQVIEPRQVWAHVAQEWGKWVVSSVIVKGRLYRKDGKLGERWAERMYSGPLDEDFEGPDWVVSVLNKEIPRVLGELREAPEDVPATERPYKITDPLRMDFDTALNRLLIRENLGGTEWAIKQLREMAKGPELGAAGLEHLADGLESLLDKRAAELATRGH